MELLDLLSTLGAGGGLTAVGIATIHAHLLALSKRLNDFEHRLDRVERAHVSPMTHAAALSTGGGMVKRKADSL